MKPEEEDPPGSSSQDAPAAGALGSVGRFGHQRISFAFRYVALPVLWCVVSGPPRASLTATTRTSSPATSVPFHNVLLPASMIERRLGQFEGSNWAREITLQALFAHAGCSKPQLTTVEIGRHRPPDLICTLPGRTPAQIIVGGHFDYVRAGHGVVDDWSGASLLPTLYQSLSPNRPLHTFLFIGFSSEEKGLAGSRYYVAHLASQHRAHIQAMVNLECLGMSDAEVWGDHANPVLRRKLFQTARALHFPLPVVNVERVGTDDTQSFRERGLPTITIHSLTQRTLAILHSPRDRMSAINMAYYYENYRLVDAYLSYLDRTLH